MYEYFGNSNELWYILQDAYVAQAETFIYLGLISSFGYANWDSGATNFHTAVKKVMAPEVGHMMGINDQPLGSGTCGGQDGRAVCYKCGVRHEVR